MTENSAKLGGAATARASKLTALLASPLKADDHDAVREFIHGAADLGLSLLFVYPNSKEPADMRTARQRNADDRRAQEAAKAEGRRDWAAVRSPSGLALATSDKTVLDRYLDQYVRTYSTWEAPDGTVVTWNKDSADAGELTMTRPVAVNLAIETGRSGVVVVDCDTAAQMGRWFGAGHVDLGTVPTVLTPGHIGPGGTADDPSTWAHSDGGHYWFVTPEGVELPTIIGALTVDGDDGFAVLWDRRYVLIPPSVRAEGEYTAAGRVCALPEQLADMIIGAGRLKLERAVQRAARPVNGAQADRVDAWAQTRSWASILEPLGWVRTPRLQSCGCENWTAPGDHATPKSATAHDEDCTAGFYSAVNPPLYVWTDHDIAPFDHLVDFDRDERIVSKLDAVAASEYNNEMSRAMDELGLTDSADLAVVDDADVVFLDSYRASPGTSTADDVGGEAEDETDRKIRERAEYLWIDREARKLLAAVDVAEVGMPPVRSLTALLDEPDDEHEYVIDLLIPVGGTRTVLSAPAKAGKTTLIGDLVHSLADGVPFLDTFTVHGDVAHRVAIVDNEMSDAMMRRWLRSKRIDNTDAVADVQTIRGRVHEFDIRDDRIRDRWARRYNDLGVDFLIIDCLAPMIEGLQLNPNTEARQFLQPVDALMAEAGISDVLIAHHMGHVSERARGDSNILGWPDSNWKIVRGSGSPGDNPDDEGADKFFSAFGRGGEVPSGQLRFDADTRRLSYTGMSRAEAHTSKTVQERIEKVVQVLADKAAEADRAAGRGKTAPDADKELTHTQLLQAVGGKKDITDKAISKAVGDLIFCRPHGKAKLYRINPNADTDRSARTATEARIDVSKRTFPGPGGPSGGDDDESAQKAV